MSEVVVVGMGPGPLKYLTREAESELLEAGKVFLRFSQHPVYDWLKEHGKSVIPFDFAYSVPNLTFAEVYKLIVSTLIKEAQLRGRVVYGISGNPSVLEETTGLLRKEAASGSMQIRIIPGMSFLDLIYSKLGLDPGTGLQIVMPRRHLRNSLFSRRVGLLVAMVMVQDSPADDTPGLELVQEYLLREFPDDHPVTLIWTPGPPEYTTKTRTVALKDLAQQLPHERLLASLYVPPVA